MKNLSLILALSMALLSTSAFANSTSSMGTAYLAIQYGLSGMQMGTTEPNFPEPPADNQNLSESANASSGGGGHRFSLGYLFNISPALQIGPEIGYLSYANNNYSYNYQDDDRNNQISFDYSGHTIDLLGNMLYHLNSSWYTSLKLGVANISQSLSASGNFTSMPKNGSSQKLLLEYGIALGYDFNSHFGLEGTFLATSGGKAINPLAEVDVTHEKVLSPSTLESVANISSAMIGLHYNF
jgi:hypothetical protein